jgi:CDP-glucose 4,6-dehydratase
VPLPDPHPGFWQGKRVLVTGHTGFKGSWAALWLQHRGARVFGLALEPEALSMCRLVHLAAPVESHIVDLRDAAAVARMVQRTQPELVLHLAAQALVPKSLTDPVGTFAVNVSGTVHLLEALRSAAELRAALIVTSDKVYAEAQPPHPHVETDRFGGADPYSASKAACELATAAMAQSFLHATGATIATARAGNVVGGGDFAPFRLVPDVVRAARNDTALHLRDPAATRPWQHVLDCVGAYLSYLGGLATRDDLPAALNFGPPPGRQPTVAELADAMTAALGATRRWEHQPAPETPERHALALDATLASHCLGWTPRLSGRRMVDSTAAWYRAWAVGDDMRAVTLQQIREYEALP